MIQGLFVRFLYRKLSRIAIGDSPGCWGQEAQQADKQGKLDRAIGEIASIDLRPKATSVKTDSAP